MKPVKRYQRFGENDGVRAQRIWQILVGYVMFKQNMSGVQPGLITRSDLASLMGFGSMLGVKLDGPLECISRFCEANQLPSLSAVVIGGDKELSYRAETAEIDRVLNEDWFSIRQPNASVLKDMAQPEVPQPAASRAS